LAKTTLPDLAAHQHRSATTTGASGGGKASGRKFSLARFDPADKPFSSGDKARDKAAVAALATELDGLQELFYADRRYKLLVVLQGTDTSGKDGTIRGVFGEMSALGVHTASWKAPSEEERAHDYLWRIHQKVPAAGEIVLFNRSHYEDVLVPVVNGSLTPEQTQQRYAHINEFERLLCETGTVILKFLLHVSKDEQRQRLQERLDDPTKRWKFAAGDLEVRKKWDEYQRAYSAAVAATGTPWAPWTIVPADSKTHRNLMIATVLKQTLLELKLRYPPGDPAVVNLRIE
jgi:PPK2 family polyphosphate:nucleotide phosphotransferase